jgi:hypothetical protein
MALSDLIKTTLVTLMSAVVFTSCGNKKDAGEHIGITIFPSSGALIVAGPGPTCFDKANTDPTSGSMPQSLSQYRISWSNFRIEWSSVDSLTIAAIRVTIVHPALAGGEFTTTLTQQEIEYLLGAPNGTVAGAPAGKTKQINTADSNRAAGTAMATKAVPCGLYIGGIQFVGASPSPFTATATIEVIGFATSGDQVGTQSPVRKKIRATVGYY